MRLYLAGPMYGYHDDNREAFRVATAKLRGAGHEIFSPPEYDDDHPGKTIRQTMAADLMWICDYAEGLALLDECHGSLGARAEIALAAVISRSEKSFAIKHWESWL